MSKLIVFISFILSGSFMWFSLAPKPSLPQNYTDEITLCITASADMKVFLDDPNFAALHPSPLPFEFNALGKMIAFPTADGTEAKGYYLPSKSKSDKWLFVFQEWWGLNDNIKQQAEKFYEDLGSDVNVLALDMYDGNVATNPTDAAQYMRGTQESRLENIVKGAASFAGNNAKIANVGWCFGGSWSLKSALLLGKNNVGSVIYYGMPERNVEKLKTLSSDVLGLFATEKNISKEIIEEFEQSMKAAGKTLNYKIFSGPHGFANPSNPNHNPEETKEAYAMALKYLKGKFK